MVYQQNFLLILPQSHRHPSFFKFCKRSVIPSVIKRGKNIVGAKRPLHEISRARLIEQRNQSVLKAGRFRPKDKDLKDRLLQSKQGILRWIIEGCLEL